MLRFRVVERLRDGAFLAVAAAFLRVELARRVVLAAGFLAAADFAAAGFAAADFAGALRAVDFAAVDFDAVVLVERDLVVLAFFADAVLLRVAMKSSRNGLAILKTCR